MTHDDDWRMRLNRAVHEFARRCETDGPEASMPALLRHVCEALDLPRAAFVRVPAAPGERPGDEWTAARTPAPAPWLDATSGVVSAVILPTGLGRSLPWRWVLGAARAEHVWSEPVISHLQILGDIVAGILERVHTAARGAERHDADATRPAARRPMRQQALPLNRRFQQIVGQSPALHTALAMLEEVIETDATVLLLGETGTGKELFAQALHMAGPRRARPLVSVNCGALPPSLIESELFGHQRGAFSGAVAQRQGRFELAHRGTLFLDEIGDLALDLQARLLRVLQEGAFERVGSSQTQAVDVRVIAATHRDLDRLVADGRFRADLYYRLNVFPVRVPTLRERREDIPALVWHIIEKRQARFHRHITHVPSAVWEALQRYSWPGNIRELENVVEGALIHSTSGVLDLGTGPLQSNTQRSRIKKPGIVRDSGRGAEPLRFSSKSRNRVS